MDDVTLATEMLRELKASNRRWFIAFLVVLTLWFATIGGFLWYVSLPVEETTVEQSADGDNNSFVGIGDMNGGVSESNKTQESGS